MEELIKYLRDRQSILRTAITHAQLGSAQAINDNKEVQNIDMYIQAVRASAGFIANLEMTEELNISVGEVIPVPISYDYLKGYYDGNKASN